MGLDTPVRISLTRCSFIHVNTACSGRSTFGTYQPSLRAIARRTGFVLRVFGYYWEEWAGGHYQACFWTKQVTQPGDTRTTFCVVVLLLAVPVPEAKLPAAVAGVGSDTGQDDRSTKDAQQAAGIFCHV